MVPADWLVVGEWLAAVGLMLVLAWEPWRRLRALGLATPATGAAGRVASPGFVFVLPLLTLATPFAAAFVPGEAALDLRSRPHLLLPGVAVALVAVVALQALLCRRALAAARRGS